MVLSLKANRKRILAVLIVIAIVVGGFIIIPKLTTAPVKHYGETAVQRREFLNAFGYVISEEPIDVRTVTIPKEFNDVYTKYNIMQKAQNFDLKPFKGKECQQFIYLISNYPNTNKEIHATLLVYQGVIIGGDVSCAEVDGFMHGFAMDSARYGEEESAKTESSKAESSAESSAASIVESSKPAEKTDAEITETTAEESATEETIAEESQVIAEETAESVDEVSTEETVAVEDYPTD